MANPETYTDLWLCIEYAKKYIEHQKDNEEKKIMSEILEQWERWNDDKKTIIDDVKFNLEIKESKICSVYDKLQAYMNFLQQEKKPNLKGVVEKLKKTIYSMLNGDEYDDWNTLDKYVKAYSAQYVDSCNIPNDIIKIIIPTISKSSNKAIKEKIKDDLETIIEWYSNWSGWDLRKNTLKPYYEDQKWNKKAYSKEILLYRNWLGEHAIKLLDKVYEKIQKDKTKWQQ